MSDRFKAEQRAGLQGASLVPTANSATRARKLTVHKISIPAKADFCPKVKKWRVEPIFRLVLSSACVGTGIQQYACSHITSHEENSADFAGSSTEVHWLWRCDPACAGLPSVPRQTHPAAADPPVFTTASTDRGTLIDTDQDSRLSVCTTTAEAVVVCFSNRSCFTSSSRTPSTTASAAPTPISLLAWALRQHLGDSNLRLRGSP